MQEFVKRHLVSWWTDPGSSLPQQQVAWHQREQCQRMVMIIMGMFFAGLVLTGHSSTGSCQRDVHNSTGVTSRSHEPIELLYLEYTEPHMAHDMTQTWIWFARWGTFHKQGIRTWISNYIHCFIRDVITHPCPNFTEVKAWMSNYIPLSMWM